MKYIFTTDGGRRVTVKAKNLKEAEMLAVETLDKRCYANGREPPVGWGQRLLVTETVGFMNNDVILIEEAIEEIQESCEHPNVTKRYGANTGNYDPQSDYYYIDWKCPDCRKVWTTEQ